MSGMKICAVVVTFKPKPDVRENLASVRRQVHGLIVVDNTSSPDKTDLLHRATVDLNFVLIENGCNLGLPAALNLGIRRAEELGYQWVVLFDQDSTVTDGFIEGLLATYQQHPRHKEIGVVAPIYVGRNTAMALPNSPRLMENGTLRAAWTSGSLIPMSIFRDYGGFEEQLFIDYLDYEFCLRLRCHGLIIVQSTGAQLLHEAGRLKTASLWGIRRFNLQNHSAGRAYYRARNRVWITKKYGKIFPELMRQRFVEMIQDCTGMLLFESGGTKKVCYSMLGLAHGLMGYMGKTIDL
jgi:rhamnosyltransferase